MSTILDFAELEFNWNRATNYVEDNKSNIHRFFQVMHLFHTYYIVYVYVICIDVTAYVTYRVAAH